VTTPLDWNDADAVAAVAAAADVHVHPLLLLVRNKERMIRPSWNDAAAVAAAADVHNSYSFVLVVVLVVGVVALNIVPGLVLCPNENHPHDFAAAAAAVVVAAVVAAVFHNSCCC
jgi:hypothetical protein